MADKYCRWCGKTKSETEFHRHKAARGGRINKCAECVRMYLAEYCRKYPLRKVWQHMMERCYSGRARYFPRYGGRGIKVAEPWHDFEMFKQDMAAGYAPGLTIDRIDNDGDYAPGNCRWVTIRENVRNSTTSRKLTAFGQTMSIVEWGERFGVPATAIYARLNQLGWSPERAVSTPPRADRRRAS